MAGADDYDVVLVVACRHDIDHTKLQRTSERCVRVSAAS
jgi:hypothetical protein